MNATIDSIGSMFADRAMRSAIDKAIRDGHASRLRNPAEQDRLFAIVRENLKAVAGTAIAEARAALDAGMIGMATPAFLSSAIEAGIKSAREWAASPPDSRGVRDDMVQPAELAEVAS